MFIHISVQYFKYFFFIYFIFLNANESLQIFKCDIINYILWRCINEQINIVYNFYKCRNSNETRKIGDFPDNPIFMYYIIIKLYIWINKITPNNLTYHRSFLKELKILSSGLKQRFKAVPDDDLTNEQHKWQQCELITEDLNILVEHRYSKRPSFWPHTNIIAE